MKTTPCSKKRLYLARAGIFLIMIALITGIPSSCAVGPDDASPSQNLQIQTWYDLDAIRDNLAGDHILMNDLDSSSPGYEELAGPTADQGKGWAPIGVYSSPAPSTGCTQPVGASSPAPWPGFAGSLDGQGFQICDLSINRSDDDFVGLFSVATAHIENIGVVNVTVTGKSYVGGLTGKNQGIVSNSYSAGNVSGRTAVGGLVGSNWGAVSGTYSTASVIGRALVGGLAGENYSEYEGTVSNSYSSGSVTGEYRVGGLVGWNYYSEVFDCYSTGNVTGSENVGGLVGPSEGSTVINSYYDYDKVLINGRKIVTTGALLGEQFNEWLANGKFLDVKEKLAEENGYYMVNNLSDFKEVLAFGQNASLKFRLNNDLDLTTEPNFHIPYFAGEFDGSGHNISNLSLDLGFASHVGLFGYLVPDGKITGLGVEDADIAGLNYVGGLVGWSPNGTVSHSYTTGSVTGRWAVGGLVGENRHGTVCNSYSTSDITGRSTVGGLVGYNWEIVSDCYATGTVTGEERVGGLVGYDMSIVSDSYSTGTVNGKELVGGLIGDATTYSDASNSLWDTQTSGQSTSAGGTGKTTSEMQDIATFSGVGWNIITVALNETNSAYTWNIVSSVTYPFLSWQL